MWRCSVCVTGDFALYMRSHVCGQALDARLLRALVFGAVRWDGSFPCLVVFAVTRLGFPHTRSPMQPLDGDLGVPLRPAQPGADVLSWNGSRCLRWQ